MDPAPAPEAAGHPLFAAVDAAETAVEHLIKLVDDGAHTDLGAFGLVEVLRHLERVRNKLPVVDGTLIQHGSEQGAPGTLSERSMVGVLVSGLRISAGDASRRSAPPNTSPNDIPSSANPCRRSAATSPGRNAMDL